MPPLEILDTCALLNLYATGRFDEMARSRSGSFAIADKVKGEAICIRKGGAGPDALDKIAVDLQPFIVSAVLCVLRLESSAEMNLFLHFAGVLDLDDGEAATCAIAVERGGTVITDERKTTRILHQHFPTLTCISSLDVVKDWADKCAVPQGVLKSVLLDIRTKATYFPHSTHPLYLWWNKIVNS